MKIGSFGGITPFESLLKNKSDMWDVAAAGPIAGIAASTALLAIGLSQSHQGGLPQVSIALLSVTTGHCDYTIQEQQQQFPHLCLLLGTGMGMHVAFSHNIHMCQNRCVCSCRSLATAV